MLNPQEGIVYDPAYGIGGMFMQSKFFEDKNRIYAAIPLADAIEIVTGETHSTKNDTYWIMEYIIRIHQLMWQLVKI